MASADSAFAANSENPETASPPLTIGTPHPHLAP